MIPGNLYSINIEQENHLSPNVEDELHAMDGLYQLKNRQRGNLTTDRQAIAGTPEREEVFSFDPLGNWTSYTAKAAGTAITDQTRPHNAANQLTSITSLVNPPPSVLGIVQDAAGNTTQCPPDTSGDWSKSYKLTWDAWSRLVKVT